MLRCTPARSADPCLPKPCLGKSRAGEISWAHDPGQLSSLGHCALAFLDCTRSPPLPISKLRICLSYLTLTARSAPEPCSAAGQRERCIPRHMAPPPMACSLRHLRLCGARSGWQLKTLVPISRDLLSVAPLYLPATAVAPRPPLEHRVNPACVQRWTLRHHVTAEWGHRTLLTSYDIVQIIVEPGCAACTSTSLPMAPMPPPLG